MFNSSLEDVVNGFLKKREKIEIRINELKENISEINQKIKVKTNDLMDFELAEDEDGRQEAKKELKELRSDLSDTNELLNVYKNKLDKYEMTDKEKEKIRVAVINDVKLQSEKKQKVAKELEKVYQQISSLEKRQKELRYQLDKIDTHKAEKEIVKLIPFIDPRLKRVDNSTQQQFISYFLGNIEGGIEEFYRLNSSYYDFFKEVKIR